MIGLAATIVALLMLAVPQARAASDCAKLKGDNAVAVPGVKVVERPFEGGDGERGYDERGIAVIDGHKDIGYRLGVFTPNGWHYLDRGPELLTDLVVKDGVVSWNRGGEPQSRAIAAHVR